MIRRAIPSNEGENNNDRSGDQGTKMKMDESTTDANAESSSAIIEISNSKVTKLLGHRDAVNICAWNPLSDLLATSSKDSTARIWDLSDNSSAPGSLVLYHRIQSGFCEVLSEKDITSLVWKWDGTLLATGGEDGRVRIWSKEGRLVFTLNEHTGPIHSLKWNIRGNYILSTGFDDKIIIWSVDTGEWEQKFYAHHTSIIDVDWRTNTVFANSAMNGTINVCEINSPNPIKTFRGHTNDVTKIKWDPQGNLLASCSDDMSLKIWSMEQDTWVHDFQEHISDIYAIEWSPTGPGTINPNMNLTLASASFDCTVRLWDVERGACVRILAKHTKAVYSVAFSPYGEFLVSGGFDDYIRIWSTQSGQVVHSYKATDQILDVCWNSRGDKIGASVCDGSVLVFDLRKL